MKKLLCTVLAMIMAVTSIPFVANANGSSFNGPNKSTDAYLNISFERYGNSLYFNGNVYNDLTNRGMSYDLDSNTLTLDNFNDKSCSIITSEMGKDFKIVFNGDCHIKNIHIKGNEYNGSLTLYGEGTLYINEYLEYTENSPLFLEADQTDSTLTIQPNSDVRVFSTEYNPSVCVFETTAEENQLVISSDNYFIGSTECSSGNPVYTGASTMYELTLFSATADDTDKYPYEYGYELQWDDTANSSFPVIYEIKAVNVEGQNIKIASLLCDESSNPIGSEGFTLTDDFVECNALSEAIEYPVYNNSDDTENTYCVEFYSLVDDPNNSDIEYCNIYKVINIDGYNPFLLPVAEDLTALPDNYTQKIDIFSYSSHCIYDQVFSNSVCLHTNCSVSVTTPPTCTATGVKTYTCTICKATKSEPIAKKAHNYKTTTAKATTSKNGSSVTKCTVCGAVKSKSTIYYPKTISLSATSYTYDGKVKKPSVKVVGSNGKAISSSNYTVSYASGRKNVGKYAVKITFKGNYSGTKTLYFTIKPKATSISSVSAGSKKFTVKWKKQATQTTGYQIQYSTNSKFSKAKTVTVSKNSTTSKTVSKLSGKKKYYVRVRTYKTVGSTKYYSAWSKAKAVTTKK
ncbi:MAG: fibronectin type III domain-containing protein [Eubacterium sp.]